MRLPLPETDKDYLRSFDVFPDPAQAERYLYDSWERMKVVLDWLDGLEGESLHTVLELGASPYYLTLLLRKHSGLQLRLANYYGSGRDLGPHIDEVRSRDETHAFEYLHFNVETDPFPFEDGSFDCVLLCELLEHLLLAPGVALGECHRVLRPGGHLLVTTPNATRLGNLVRLLKGRNIYDGYSPNGPYGRHNREYTMAELAAILTDAGFRIVRREVHNIYPHPLRSRLVQALRPEVWREHLFLLGARA